jgi:nucleoside-diphosphate-sugar epimerase
MKFTVYGSSGVIGSHVTAYLRRCGFAVNTPSRNEIDQFGQPLGHVLYCVGVTADFRSRPIDTVQAHVCVLANILRKGDFSSLVYLSSTRIYGGAVAGKENSDFTINPSDPSDLYNLSKLMGESLCLNCSREGVKIARISNVVGGSDDREPTFIPSLIRAAEKGKIVLRSELRSEKDYIHIDDVALLLKEIACRGRNEIYNVAGGRQISHGEWIERLVARTGCSVEVEKGAPLIQFVPIDISKVVVEFGFKPQSVFTVVQESMSLT